MNLELHSEWVSAHLFYNVPWERMLVDGLRPFVDQSIAKEQASAYFFVRYWEHGPHIRLRMKTDHPGALREDINRYFSEYFSLNPSLPPSNPNESDYPNNSIQFIPYEPEMQRYGGDKAIYISEQLFFASSKVVLKLLDEKNWDLAVAAGAALHLHLALVYAFGYTRAEAIDFFSAYIIPNGLDPTPENLKTLFDSYQYRLGTVNQGIPAYCRHVWDSLQKPNSIADERLKLWIESLYQIRSELDSVIKRESFYLPNGIQNVYRSRPEYSYLLSSHVHMTNNRLGIATVEEPFLNYLLMTALN